MHCYQIARRMGILVNIKKAFNLPESSPDGIVAMSPANGLVDTGFASQYRLQPRAGF